MKFFRTILKTATLFAAVAAPLSFSSPAFADNHNSYGAKAKDAYSKATQQNIVETAVSAGNFTTLATALTQAGLIETLSGEGPYTVFAPTDDAFKKLPEGTLDGLLKDKEALKQVLLYHVVPGKVMAEDVVGLTEAKTAAGIMAPIKVYDGKVKVGGAKVVKTDIKASNGVIHVIDSVMIPPSAGGIENSIVDVAASAGDFNTLAKALKATGLAEVLDTKEGPYTVFAPTDEAFSKLPAGTLESLLANPDKLKSILLYHVVEGKVTSKDVANVSSAKTLSGNEISVNTAGGGVQINNANVVKADVMADNGVIHVIDTVLIPE